MKIVMSGSASDKLDWQKHIRSKKRREELAKAFKNPKKPFRVVIVRDMWLTWFDAASLHGFDYHSPADTPAETRMPLIAQAVEPVPQPKDAKPPSSPAMTDLSQA